MIRSSRAVFVQGIVTCLLNPKAWLFILAVYPQFMTLAYGPLAPQALVMGAMTISMQFLVYGGLAVAAAHGRDALVSNPPLTIWVGRVAGLLLVAIAGLHAAARLERIIGSVGCGGRAAGHDSGRTAPPLPAAGQRWPIPC